MKKFSTNKILKDLYNCFLVADCSEQDAADMILSCFYDLRFFAGKDPDGDTPEKDGYTPDFDDFWDISEKIKYSTCFCEHDSKLERKLCKIAAELKRKLKKAGN